MDPNKLFMATGETTAELFEKSFYIPPYQRDYLWSRSENVDRLFEDLSIGFKDLLENENANTYLGTLILFYDSGHKTVLPSSSQGTPRNVQVVVDGQQRIITLIMIYVHLHQEIQILLHRLRSQRKTSSAFEYFLEEARAVSSEVEDIIQIDQRRGNSPYCFSPRVIRAYDDCWSWLEAQTKYKSDIASLLFGYISHKERLKELSADSDKSRRRQGRPTGKNKFKVNDDGSPLTQNFAYISRLVTGISSGTSKWNSVAFEEVIESDRLQRSLLNNATFDESVKSYLHSFEPTSHFKNLNKLINLILFTHYLQKHTSMTIVEAKDDDFALTLFDSLNTTGQPLSALETFKPKVMEAETLNDYHTSISKSHFTVIDDYLGDLDSEKRKKPIDNIILSFALAENAFKCPKRSSEQRKYLNTRYARLSDVDSKRLMTSFLSDVTLFIQKFWADQNEVHNFCGDSLSGRDVEMLTICLSALKQANHTIVIAPLSRMFSMARSDSSSVDWPQFLAVLKAITAFSTIWRCCHNGTAGIDGIYRQLMEKGCAEVNLPPLKRDGSENEVAVDSLKEAFRHFLVTQGDDERQVPDKKKWVQIVSTLDVYKQARAPFTRFFLFCAMHDCIDDPAHPGLLKRGAQHCAPILDRQHWHDLVTVEHVAPQTREDSSDADPDSWDQKLYVRSRTDWVGNLTLLPSEVNAGLGNKPWSYKKIIYSILSEPDMDKRRVLIPQAKGLGLPVDTQMLENLRHVNYSQLKSLSCVEDWDYDFVAKRSRRLAELAWDYLAPWLGF